MGKGARDVSELRVKEKGDTSSTSPLNPQPCQFRGFIPLIIRFRVVMESIGPWVAPYGRCVL